MQIVNLDETSLFFASKTEISKLQDSPSSQVHQQVFWLEVTMHLIAYQSHHSKIRLEGSNKRNDCVQQLYYHATKMKIPQDVSNLSHKQSMSGETILTIQSRRH